MDEGVEREQIAYELKAKGDAEMLAEGASPEESEQIRSRRQLRDARRRAYALRYGKTKGKLSKTRPGGFSRMHRAFALARCGGRWCPAP